MKNNSYSLGSLMLLMMSAAVGLVSIRWALLLIWNSPTAARANDTVGLMILGGVCGALIGVGLSVWNHSAWWKLVPACIAGACLGVAAGAQFTAKIDWWVLIIGPIALVAASVVVAIRCRAKVDAADTLRVSSGVAPSAASSPATAVGNGNPYAPISRS